MASLPLARFMETAALLSKGCLTGDLGMAMLFMPRLNSLEPAVTTSETEPHVEAAMNTTVSLKFAKLKFSLPVE